MIGNIIQKTIEVDGILDLSYEESLAYEY